MMEPKQNSKILPNNMKNQMVLMEILEEREQRWVLEREVKRRKEAVKDLEGCAATGMFLLKQDLTLNLPKPKPTKKKDKKGKGQVRWRNQRSWSLSHP